MLHELKTFDYKDTAPKDCITWVFQNFVPVAKIQGDKHYSIISDHLGTPILATDEQGNKVWERTLDIYGRVRKEEGEKGFCNMLYQGQYLDTETELVYNYKRYYSQETGAYISQDPIGLAGNNPTLYAYVHDPNSWVDPFGLRGLWKLTNEGSSKRRVIGNRVYYQHKTTGLWWSVDTAGHGGSAFKVFKETEGGTLEWYRDADKYGDFIDPNKKHKGKKGKKVCGG